MADQGAIDPAAVEVRRAVPADLDALEALENTVFQHDQLSRRSLRYYIGAPTAAFLVAAHDATILGDAIVAFRSGSSLARLYSLAVAPGMGGQGFGRRLLGRCEAEARARGCTRLRLEVRDDNAAAIGLYRAADYAEFGRYPDYYDDGRSALRFEKRFG